MIEPPRIPYARSLGALGVHLSPAAAGKVAELAQAVARLNGTTIMRGSPMQELVDECRASVEAASRRPDSAQPLASRDELSSAEAAEILGVSEHQVNVHIRARNLRGRKVNNRWRIPRAAVEEFARYRADQGH